MKKNCDKSNEIGTRIYNPEIMVLREYYIIFFKLICNNIQIISPNNNIFNCIENYFNNIDNDQNMKEQITKILLHIEKPKYITQLICNFTDILINNITEDEIYMFPPLDYGENIQTHYMELYIFKLFKKFYFNIIDNYLILHCDYPEHKDNINNYIIDFNQKYDTNISVEPFDCFINEYNKLKNIINDKNTSDIINDIKFIDNYFKDNVIINKNIDEIDYYFENFIENFGNYYDKKKKLLHNNTITSTLSYVERLMADKINTLIKNNCDEINKEQNDENKLNNKKQDNEKYYNYYFNNIKNLVSYLLNNGNKDVNWRTYYLFRFLPKQMTNIYYGYFGNLFNINCGTTIDENDLFYIKIINLIFTVADYINQDIDNINKCEINNLFTEKIESLDYKYSDKCSNEYANKLYDILICFNDFYVNVEICNKNKPYENVNILNFNMQNDNVQIDHIQKIVPELFNIYKNIMSNKKLEDDMLC